MLIGGSGMRDINKAHPFIVLLRKRNDELDTSILETTKKLLSFSIMTVLTCIITYIVTKSFNYLWIYILIGAWNILTSFLFIRKSVKNSYTESVYNFIYSEEFNTVYVNDEKMINMIEDINKVFGIVEFVNEKIIFDIIVQILLIILYFYFII